LDKNVCSKEKLFEWVKKTYKAESGGGDNGAGNGCGPKKPEPITIDEIRKKGKLTVADNITFNHIVDILNGLFDCGYRAWMKATWERSHWERLWFPKLALEYYGTKKPLHPIWSNWFEDKNNSVLLEQYRGDNFDNFSYPDPIWHNVKLKRLVFAGYLDKNSKKMVYKFYGVFIFDGVLPNQIIRYKKIGEELIL
jgi:hypothetical protein